MNLYQQQQNEFTRRHIGPDASQTERMLKTIGAGSLNELIDRTVPASIRLPHELGVSAPMSEFEYLQHIQELGHQNALLKDCIGMGYYGTITPSVILRNLFENPGWYTQYTPYQAEIAQGRLESLLNFQTMVSDFTALPIANASLLDEATAAAEAMNLLFASKGKEGKNRFFVDEKI
ncbi:MAG TPA: glycine dehydrogenase (aminomethyl-transferring), partial [Chitinophagaceae bacterium]|nr:glycine dehydrogenase (aminomethyl-transferring) [Chitinophagaceae bacterium]